DVEAHRIGIAGGALLHTFLDVGGQAVEVQQRLGVHADHAVDDELQTGQADTSVGQLGEVEGAVRIADVHHDLERQLGHGVDGVLANVEPSWPSKMKPVSPSAQDTVTPWPSFSTWVALPQPTTAGMPSSRAMMAAWQVRPPRLVTMALARFMTGSQSGSVMSETSTSPGCTLSISDTSLMTRTGPAPMRWPMARPSTRTLPFSFSR